MQGLEKIKARIIEEARQKADATIKQAEKEAGEIMEAAKAKAAQKREEILGKARVEAENAEKRVLALAELELRKQSLKVKQDLVEETFKRALRKLAAMPAEHYAGVLADMIYNAVQDGTEEVVFSASDRARLNLDSVLDSVNKKLAQSGKTANIRLSPESGNFSGGFILKRGDVELNNTFEVLLKMNREELEQDVLKILFG